MSQHDSGDRQTDPRLGTTTDDNLRPAREAERRSFATLMAILLTVLLFVPLLIWWL